MTNKEYAEKNDDFRKACEAANIPATSRQASKWRRGKGLAHKIAKGGPNYEMTIQT